MPERNWCPRFVPGEAVSRVNTDVVVHTTRDVETLARRIPHHAHECVRDANHLLLHRRPGGNVINEDVLVGDIRGSTARWQLPAVEAAREDEQRPAVRAR